MASLRSKSYNIYPLGGTATQQRTLGKVPLTPDQGLRLAPIRPSLLSTTFSQDASKLSKKFKITLGGIRSNALFSELRRSSKNRIWISIWKNLEKICHNLWEFYVIDIAQKDSIPRKALKGTTGVQKQG